MVIQSITKESVLEDCRHAVGLSPAAGKRAQIELELIAALLRRCAGFLCPCSLSSLRRALVESLAYLDDDAETLPSRVEVAIDGLLIGGDLLELRDVVTEDPDVRGTHVFAAPPAFVVRPSGSVFLLGVVPDQDMFLPRALSSRIVCRGATRMIVPKDDENLPGELGEYGLQQLSTEAWLKAPRVRSAGEYVGDFQRTLDREPPSGAIDGLEIIDPARSVRFYRGRWTVPKSHHIGLFVGRRPTEYGAPIWCVIKLVDGSADRLFDLPPKGSRWRGCDSAWHLQMALDRCRNAPQHYRRQPETEGIRFDFYSPLPQWAERRLMLFGNAVPVDGSLLSFVLLGGESDTEERFLREELWLEPTVDSG